MTPSNLQPIALKVPDAAQALGLSSRTLWKLVRDGTLPALRVGTRVLILYSSLVQFAESKADRTGSLTRPDAFKRKGATV
jgi:excisionase family DNA binding protein